MFVFARVMCFASATAVQTQLRVFHLLWPIGGSFDQPADDDDDVDDDDDEQGLVFGGWLSWPGHLCGQPHLPANSCG